MTQSFVIEGRLPSLNDYIEAERANRYAAANMKKKWQDYIAIEIRIAKLKKVEKPVVIFYRHFVPDKRRDRDNITAIAHKFTQDALVATGILKDDGWDSVVNSFDFWQIDRVNPRIEVALK